MAEAARLQVVVESDTRPFESGLKSAEGKLGAFGDRVKGLGGLLGTALTAGAVAGTAAIVGGFTGTIGAAAGFERTMSGVKAVSGATGDELKQLSGLALQLGKDTSFSASEAAAGIEELVKGGLTIPDIMNGAAKSTLALAEAGGVTLPEAATIASNALAQFNLKGTDMAHVADLIAGAANASAIDVNDFRLSLAASGAVANTIGFSFDDLAQAITAMGRAGVKSSDAGTSLKTFMMSLQPTTEKQIALARELGIVWADGSNAFFDATGKVRSMAEVAQILQNATKGMTEQQKLATLETLFGSDAIRAAAILAEEGAAGLGELAGAMGKVTAAGVGAERLNNLSGSFKTLTGSVETAAITLGTAFLPVIRRVVDGATGLVNQLIPVFEKLGPQIVGSIFQIGERLGTFFGKLRDGSSLASTVNAAFGDLIPHELNAVLDAVDGAFRTVKDAVGGVIATLQTGGLAGLWQQVQDAMSQFAPTGERISTAVQAIATEVGKLVPEPIKTFVADLLGTAQAAAQGADPLRALADVVNAVSGAVESAVKWLKDNEVVLYAAAGAVGALTLAFLAQKAALLASIAVTEILTIKQGLLNLVMSANPVMILVLALGALVGALVYAYKTNEDFRKVVDAVFAFLKRIAGEVIQYVIARFGEFVESARWVGARLEELRGTAARVFEAIKTKVETVWAAVDAVTRTVWDALSPFLTALWDALGAAVARIWGAIQVVTDTVWPAVRDTIAAAMAGAVESVSSRLAAIVQSFRDAQATIGGIVEAIKSVVERIFGEVESRANAAKSVVEGILNTVQGWLRDIQGALSAARDLLGQGRPSAPAPAEGGGEGGSYELRSSSAQALPLTRTVAAGPGTVNLNVNLPGGVYYGALSDLAYAVKPELERVVTAGQR